MTTIPVYQDHGCRNVSGIAFNPGWYALCECILTSHTPCDVLHRWCGLEKKPKTVGKPAVTRRYVPVDVSKLRSLREEKHLSYSALAKMAGTSLYPFWKLFRNNEGRMLEESLRLLENRLELKKGELELASLGNSARENVSCVKIGIGTDLF